LSCSLCEPVAGMGSTHERLELQSPHLYMSGEYRQLAVNCLGGFWDVSLPVKSL
jgi:hypothetical protein